MREWGAFRSALEWRYGMGVESGYVVREKCCGSSASSQKPTLLRIRGSLSDDNMQ